MVQVEIILATFNGEAYIRQQILSIICQDFKDWRLLIHDDGSSDNTVKIIHELEKKDNRIYFIDDQEKFGSPQKNFMHLLSHTSAELICFCDQDDIWFENKLESLIKKYRKTAIPTAIISSGYLYQTNTNKILGEINYKISNLKELLFVNGGIHGSRALINKSMRDQMLRFNKKINMHDHLMSLIACSFGHISYLDKPLFLYRQHSKNVTGNIIKNPLKRVVRAFTKIDQKYLVSTEIYKCVSDFLNTYQDVLSSSDKKIIQQYLKMKDYGKFYRVFQIAKNGFSICNRGRIHLIIKAATRKYSDKTI